MVKLTLPLRPGYSDTPLLTRANSASKTVNVLQAALRSLVGAGRNLSANEQPLSSPSISQQPVGRPLERGDRGASKATASPVSSRAPISFSTGTERST